MVEVAQEAILLGPEEHPAYSRQWYEAFRDSLGEGVCRQLGIYAVPDDLVLSVVIPVYNERATLLELVERVRAVPIRKQIILVDDGSRDGSRDVLRELQAEPGEDQIGRA